MKRIVTGSLLIPIVLILVFLPAPFRWLFTLAAAMVSMLAGWELLTLCQKGGAAPPKAAVLAAQLLLFLGNDQWPDLTLSLFGSLSLALLLLCTFTSPTDRMMADAATAVFCLFYTGLTLVTIPMIQDLANGPSLLTFLFCAVWAGDIAALYVGRSFGRHKLAPQISPNKSWEGAAGSLAGSLLITLILLGLAMLAQRLGAIRLSFPEGTGYYLLLAVVVNVFAQVGDLAESALKRSVSTKDSGSLLPGHGGVLDRIDALLVAAPVLWYSHVLLARLL